MTNKEDMKLKTTPPLSTGKIKKIMDEMSPEQRADLAYVTDGWMTRENYDRKWGNK